MKFAAWWRATPFIGAGMASLGLGGCYDVFERPPQYPEPMLSEAPDTVDQHVDALQLQMREGWNVGHEELELRLPSPTLVDVDGGEGWRARVSQLAAALAPLQPWLVPYYVPTLFSAPAAPDGQLRAALTPMHSRAMDEDFARGRALANLIAAASADGRAPGDLALVVDAPGPRAVAVAAGLAPLGEPVFTFGNWPHPAGAVPAHETLAAALYYAPAFIEAARLPARAPVWVLDANRLAVSPDPDRQFDNRYGVTLPDAETLQRHGIRRILYVNASGDVELDDLNRGFAQLCAAGLEIATVSLADFERAPRELVAVAEDEDDDDDEPLPDDAGWFFRFEGGFGARFFFGGCPFWHARFWERSGWYRIAATRTGWRTRTFAPAPARNFGSGGARVIAPRATAFAGFHGQSAQVVHPGTLGHVWVRSERASGQLVGVHHAGHWSGTWLSHGGGAARSGSLGRVGGGWGGGHGGYGGGGHGGYGGGGHGGG